MPARGRPRSDPKLQTPSLPPVPGLAAPSPGSGASPASRVQTEPLGPGSPPGLRVPAGHREGGGRAQNSASPTSSNSSVAGIQGVNP